MTVHYPIDYVNEVRNPGTLGDYGEVLHTPEDRIIISQAFSSVRQKETLLHETIHCLDDVLTLKFEEDTVDRLSQGLFQWMRDNADTVKWMLSKEGES